jgi:hypothetical protein
MKPSNPIKILLILFCLGVSVTGFMIKLPAGFRHYDKELHTAFYFCAAAFLNVLFANRNIIRHAVIFFVLYIFGVAIEYAQEYSNTLLHKRIHGRYDPEDVLSNVKGLVAFSILWIVVVSVMYLYHREPNKKSNSQP